jgi:hypothetical protein
VRVAFGEFCWSVGCVDGRVCDLLLLMVGLVFCGSCLLLLLLMVLGDAEGGREGRVYR